MGLRIVFGKDFRNDQITIIGVVAVGKRRRYKVYHEAVNRITKKQKIEIEERSNN